MIIPVYNLALDMNQDPIGTELFSYTSIAMRLAIIAAMSMHAKVTERLIN